MLKLFIIGAVKKMKVVYGHTDSIYVQIDDIDRALSAIKTIEEKVREKFPNVLGLDEHPVVLEFEKYFSALVDRDWET